MLGRVVGDGRVVAKVTAEVDFAQVSETQTIYDAEGASPRTLEKRSDSQTGVRPGPYGVAGVASNTPGQPPAANGETKYDTTRTNEVTNYEVPQTIRRTTRPVGAIKKLNIAVVLDGKLTKTKDDKGQVLSKVEPWSPERLKDFEIVVAGAVGLDRKRGDSLDLKTLEFTREDFDEAQKALQTEERKSYALNLAIYAVFGLVIALFFMSVVRPLVKWITENTIDSVDSFLPQTIEELEKMQKNTVLPGLEEAVPVLPDKMDPEKVEGEMLKEKIVTLVDANPHKAALILKDWLHGHEVVATRTKGKRVETTIMAFENYDDLNGVEKAALLLNALGNTVTSQIFKKMKDNDVKRMVGAMSVVEKVPITIVKRVLEDFYTEIAEEDTLIFGHAAGKEFILSTLGEDRAKTVLGQLSVVDGSRTLEALELVDSRTLANFLVNEHPQTVSLILAHLEPDKKCEVLKRLPEGIQTEVVMRIANLDFISPNLIAQVDEVLKQELATLGSIDTQQLGGVAPIAEMLNVMDKTTEQNIMARVEEKDPQLAEEIRKLMFVFEDIIFIDDRGMQQMMKEIDTSKLVIALKTAPEEIKDKIFRNISQRAAQLLREDLEAMGPMRLSDIEQAQTAIVNVAKRLEAEGKIIISRGGEGDALV